ncbi:MAG: sulfite exporter TauE/SafE family protein [Zetaproteobacteria bacterium]|nr:sulfite exporter TauE/SafE family protein [Zetaproteobacteria bacterium]
MPPLFDPQWLTIFLLLGAFVGFMAGLLGIGGGGIMVPMLTTIFLAQGMPLEQVVHIALGTSMASIVVTSLSSMRAHHLRQGVLWPIVFAMAPGILVGTYLGTYLASLTSSFLLSILFAMFMAYISLQMFIDKKPQPSRQLSGRFSLSVGGAVIGGLSALVSIGGGSFTVPYLIWQNVDIKKAIGTSAAIGFPISFAGTIGYMFNAPLHSNATSPYLIGFIDFYVVLLISIASALTAPLGARMAHRLPIPMLKKVFACLLIGLSMKMVITIVGAV